MGESNTGLREPAGNSRPGNETGKYLVVDIGGTKIQVATAEKNAAGFKITDLERIPTLAASGGEKVAERLALFLQKRVQLHRYEAIGVASAGVVDSQRGKIISATDIMPGWGGIELGAILSEATDLPSYLLGDVHGHCLGEARQGAGQGYQHVLSCGIGTGMGGAFYTGGRPHQGAHGIAGHLGHVYHDLAREIPCSCGRKGHIESIASGTGMGKYFAHAYGRSGLDGKAISELAAQGDQEAVKALNEVSFALGQCLGSLANMLDPEIVIISGSVSESGQPWWDSLRRGYQDQAMDGLQNLPLRKGQTGDLAPLLGAAYWIERQSASA